MIEVIGDCDDALPWPYPFNHMRKCYCPAFLHNYKDAWMGWIVFQTRLCRRWQRVATGHSIHTVQYVLYIVRIYTSVLLVGCAELWNYCVMFFCTSKESQVESIRHASHVVHCSMNRIKPGSQVHLMVSINHFYNTNNYSTRTTYSITHPLQSLSSS